MSTAADPEVLVLSSEEAEKRAKEHRSKPDPYPSGSSGGIMPSLLSAEHVERYVMTTGLIAPFHKGGGRKARLKKASYEGRIGNKAFVFDSLGGLKPILNPPEPLRVPANSIVFVESNLEFRLPRYIALRFNLQIQHVHRGLLLGTGPLVDPGYWGKLCIPLHNLTDEPYEIPLKEGLIWVEFTKTTSDSNVGRITLAEGEVLKEHWDIEKFIWRAARQYERGQPAIGIRSSIPEVGRKARDDARDAAEEAAKASASAANAQTDAETARETTFIIQIVGTLAAAAVIIAAYALWATFVSISDNEIAKLEKQIEALKQSQTQAETATLERSVPEANAE